MMPRGALEARPGYDRLQAYSPGGDPACAIDLSDNTNQWGMCPPATTALAEAAGRGVTRYPSRYGEALKDAIAARYSIDPSMVVTGAGSDGVLEPAIRAFGVPGDRMVLADPTFVMAGAFGVMNGLEPIAVPLGDDYGVDATRIVASQGRITYLCSPNNPTGGSIGRDALERVVAGAPGLVIIDEAYAEFAGHDALDLARTSDRVLVTRTFSKAYGLAGLRIGYGIGAPTIIAAVEKARGPYTVGALAECAAIAAMRDGQAWVHARVADALEARARLRDGLERLGLRPAPSDANFLFVPLSGSARVAQSLARRGIGVRAFVGLCPVSAALRQSGGEALRITVGPVEMMDALLAALGDIRSAGGGW